MTHARMELVDLDTTFYYHCICRCVRRAFLWGEDHLTGRSYEHRKGWVIERLAELGKVFAVEVGAYTVMSNRCHVVVRIDREKAQSWSEDQVMGRVCGECHKRPAASSPTLTADVSSKYWQ